MSITVHMHEKYLDMFDNFKCAVYEGDTFIMSTIYSVRSQHIALDLYFPRFAFSVFCETSRLYFHTYAIYAYSFNTYLKLVFYSSNEHIP